MIRLFASDLDGTFVSEPNGVSACNREAVALAHRAGVPFVVATGRPRRWVRFLHDLIGHDDPLAVVSNGAEIIRLATGETMHRWPVPPEVARATFDAIGRAIPGTEFGVEYGSAFGVSPGSLGWRFDRPEDVVQAPLDALLARREPVLKILAMHRELDTESLHRALVPVLPGEIAATFSYLATPGIVELAAAEVSKAHALALICEDLGVAPAEVAAFGDMPNDLAMLTWAGHGFVMPSAHPSLLASGLPVLSGNPEECVGRKIAAIVTEMLAGDDAG